MINIENLVKEKINKLWCEFGDEEFCRFSPNSIAEVPDDGLICIGINPSLIEKVRLKLIEKNNIDCEFHKLTDDENKEYHYFKKFFDLGKKTEMNWGPS